MNLPEREKRDWSLIAFVVPIGILLIMIVGQIAVRIVPIWSVNAGMNSNLDPDSEAAQPISLIPPLLPQILTPMAWAESYLTPVGSISFPPFIIIEPTATASPSPTPVEPTEPPITPTAPTQRRHNQHNQHRRNLHQHNQHQHNQHRRNLHQQNLHQQNLHQQNLHQRKNQGSHQRRQQARRLLFPPRLAWVSHRII